MAKKNIKTIKKTKTTAKSFECACTCKSLYSKVKSFLDGIINKIKNIL